jgi:hypothetical protein
VERIPALVRSLGNPSLPSINVGVRIPLPIMPSSPIGAVKAHGPKGISSPRTTLLLDLRIFTTEMGETTNCFLPVRIFKWVFRARPLWAPTSPPFARKLLEFYNDGLSRGSITVLARVFEVVLSAGVSAITLVATSEGVDYEQTGSQLTKSTDDQAIALRMQLTPHPRLRIWRKNGSPSACPPGGREALLG